MSIRQTIRILRAAVIGCACFSRALPAAIVLDFSPDQRSLDFFARHPPAQAAVRQAAADLEQWLDLQVRSVADDLPRIARSVGQSEVFFDWTMTYADPAGGGQVAWDPGTLGDGDIRIFVGWQPILGDTLGLGGTSNHRLSFGGTGIPDELGQAFAAVLAESNRVMRRGAGPVIDHVDITDIFLTGETFVGDVGAFGGTLSLDADSNNDGFIDTDQQLQAFWHFDWQAPVPAEKTDLYSVALHELLHAMGLGSSQAWMQQRQDGIWLGSAVRDLMGSGAGILFDDGDHLDPDLLSPRLSDGALHSPAFIPFIRPGQRLALTQLDVALLTDIGWTTRTGELPGDFNGDGVLGVADLQLLATALIAQDARFDLNGDQQVTAVDRDIWVTELKATYYGDANLDGEFNSGDFVIVFTAATYETGQPANWGTGDWNLDGLFDSADLITAFTAGGYEQGPRQAAVVPEPVGFGVWFMLVVPMLARQGRRPGATCRGQD